MVTGPISAHAPRACAQVGVVTHNLRPKFPDACPEWYKSLAGKCWRKDPKSRPPFSEVSACLMAALADKAKDWQPVDPDA